MVCLETWIDPEKLARKKAIGVVADADSDPARRRQQLVTLLRRSTGANIPDNGGWAVSPQGAKIGCFVVPGGTLDHQGHIETLVWKAWSSNAENQTGADCIETFMRCMRAAGIEPKSLDKARIGALLSVANEDDPRLGSGARSGVFDLESDALSDLREFLEGFRGL